MNSYPEINSHPKCDNRLSAGTPDTRFTVFLVLYLVFGVYKVPQFPAVSFGDLILMLLMIDVAIRKHKLRIAYDPRLLLFVTYSLVISFLVIMIEKGNASDTITRIIRDAFFYVYIYSFAYTYLNYKVFVKWLKTICVLLGALIIAQEIVFMLTGYLIPGFFLSATITQTTSANQIYRHTIVSATRNGYLKANGFMTEGAHCAQALAIAIIATYDFEEHDKKSVRLAIFFTIASVLTFSASALFFVSILWIMIIVSMIKAKKFSSRIGIPLLLLLLGLIIFSFVGFETNIASVLNRIITASSSETADNSSFFRIYKGFVFWQGLPLANKIFGIGFGNYSSMTTLYQGKFTQILMSEYMNSLSYILVSGGIIGLILLLIVFVSLYRTCNLKGKITIILLLFMSISSSPYISIYWVMLMLLIMFNNRKFSRYEVSAS